MGPENDTRTGTLYINGEPISEIKIPSRQVEQSSFPRTFGDVSFKLTMDCSRWFWWKLKWLMFKDRLKALIHRITHF